MLGDYGGETQPGGGGNVNVNTDLYGALAIAGASAYDTYQSNRTAKKNTDKTIAANKEQAELQYQRDLQMWNAQNMYNSPAAQMARFKQAGLNPNLIYGQGNPGNASNVPAYHPPHIQYAYEAPAYGAAISSILPTLMSVGSWMQDMRLKEARLKNVEQGTSLGGVKEMQARQLIDYLKEHNPQMLRKAENDLSLFPYQQSAKYSAADLAWRKVMDFSAEYKHKYGHDLFTEDPLFKGNTGKFEISGMRKLQQAEQLAKLKAAGYKNKLLEAQSSWADMDITNPQAIMQMVFQGIMHQAGVVLRSGKSRSMNSRTRRREVQRGKDWTSEQTWYDND